MKTAITRLAVGILGLTATRSVETLAQPEFLVDRVAQARACETLNAWPDFDIEQIPIGFYAEPKTWINSKTQPEGFTGDGTWFRQNGRHDAFTANTAVQIDGQWNAVFMAASRRDTDSWVRLILHESFHAHQREHMPWIWGVNEVALFGFMITDSDFLAARRIETALLKLAFETRDPGWAKTFCKHRANRLNETGLEYIRGIERVEGLADYVAGQAGPGDNLLDIPEHGYAPENTRSRAYVTGNALAQLLDIHRPGWKLEMVNAKGGWLDEMLADAVSDAEPEALDAKVVAAIESLSTADAKQAQDTRQHRVDEALTAPGWTIQIMANPAMWPSNFDPMNVMIAGSMRVLHGRMLELGNDTIGIKMIGHTGITTGIGPDPLWNGIKKFIIPGLGSKPVLESGDQKTIFRSGPLTGWFGPEYKAVWDEPSQTLQLEPAG